MDRNGHQSVNKLRCYKHRALRAYGVGPPEGGKRVNSVSSVSLIHRGLPFHYESSTRQLLSAYCRVVPVRNAAICSSLLHPNRPLTVQVNFAGPLLVLASKMSWKPTVPL